jgi:hypothetical protein
MMKMDEADIVAYVDGEAGSAGRDEMARLRAADATLDQKLSFHERLCRELRTAYGSIGEEPLPEHYVQRIAGSSQGGEILPFACPVTRRRAWYILPLAASLAGAAFLGSLVGSVGASGDLQLRDQQMFAGGALHRALETQLASASTQEHVYRMGVSFVGSENVICRTFHGERLEGIACRDGRDWRIAASAATEPRPQPAEYAPANSASAAILGLAQNMMVGDRLDVRGEQRAREKGWLNVPR